VDTVQTKTVKTETIEKNALFHEFQLVRDDYGFAYTSLHCNNIRSQFLHLFSSCTFVKSNISAEVL
jgi:hypothetical protein